MPLPAPPFLFLSESIELAATETGYPEDHVRTALTEAALAGVITATGCRHLSAHPDLARYFDHPVLADREIVPLAAWGTAVSWAKSRVGRYDLVRFNRADFQRWLAAGTEELSASTVERQAAKSSEIPSGTRTNRAAAAEQACGRFLSELTERPTSKDAAFEAAKKAVESTGPAPLSRKAFERAWANTVPNDWKRGGRRRAKPRGNPDPI